jgi:antitoxin (DNA-binding transcriptional repressor) of toxin-antitoxin stability system
MMATIMAITVGVRDLKDDAPRLVKRAAGGERIVVTRYGRALAVLGPVEGAAEGQPSNSMRAWEEERRVFESIRPRLERRYRGKYVAIHGGRVVGADVDADRLFERAWKKLRGKVFFIGRVGAEPPIVDMPGVEIV